MGKQTDLFLLDFSKAFDKVSHLKLLYKLSTFGITGNTLKWTEAFLIGRSQTVILERESSKEVPVTSGYHRCLYWARSTFFCTLTTPDKISKHKLDSLLMIPRFTKAVVPVLVLLLVAFVVYSKRRFVVCLSVCHFVLVFFSPFSIAITSLGEERANLSAFRTFVRFVLV